LATHRQVELICFNGKKAAQMFQRFVVLDNADVSRRFATLPSTSPAYASMTYDDKLATWRRTITRRQTGRDDDWLCDTGN
jgi:G:T/U-mismatch repair DNA glycosylase